MANSDVGYKPVSHELICTNFTVHAVPSSSSPILTTSTFRIEEVSSLRFYVTVIYRISDRDTSVS